MDTILRLDGEVTGTSHHSEGIAYFVDQLPRLVVRKIAKDRTDAIKQLATGLRQVTFTPPEGFDRVAFWPLGVGRDDWPFHDRIDRLAVISPFLTSGCISRLSKLAPIDTLISRPETFDDIGADALAGVRETLVLSPLVDQAADDDNDGSDAARRPRTEEEVASASTNELTGHTPSSTSAKSPIDRGSDRFANATDSAFGRNVELLVELEGTKPRCGIEATLGSGTGAMGLGKILQPCRPDRAAPQKPPRRKHWSGTWISWFASYRRRCSSAEFPPLASTTIVCLLRSRRGLVSPRNSSPLSCNVPASASAR